LIEEMYGPAKLWRGIQGKLPVSDFVSGEDLFLSATNGAPTMYVTMQDYGAPNGAPNPWFDHVVELFMAKCGGRLHRGKRGWVKYQPNIEEAVEYLQTWSEFGCAVNQLDPTGKFFSESNVWRWNASDVYGKEIADFWFLLHGRRLPRGVHECASPICYEDEEGRRS
jgi:D-arabinono-1,4-lactone oxidase